MREILNFKSMQDMCNEAEDFLAKVSDLEIKACAKLLLVSCYAYMDEYVIDNTKKTYKNLATLVKHEMLKTEYNKETGNSAFHDMINKVPDRVAASKVYNLYYNCSEDLKNKAQMHLMNLLLPHYIK